jgi:S1-C subfamily serine protease
MKKSIKILLLASLLFNACSISAKADIPQRYQRDNASELLYKNVVRIYGDQGHGTGWFYEKAEGDMVLVTNRHVCKGLGADMYAHSDYLKRDFKLGSVEIQANHDLCIIDVDDSSEKLDETDIEGLQLAETDDLIIEQDVLTAGYPHQRGFIINEGVFKRIVTINMPELVKNKTECDTMSGTYFEVPNEDIFSIVMGGPSMYLVCDVNYETYQSNISVLGGQSGSPVVDKDGKVVAMCFAGDSDDAYSSYIIPVKYIREDL